MTTTPADDVGSLGAALIQALREAGEAPRRSTRKTQDDSTA